MFNYKQPPRTWIRPLLAIVAAIVLGWIVVAETVFALQHPELTDTQRLIRIWDALRFR